MTQSVMSEARMPQSRAEFEARLRRIGAERYHDLHPFHDRLHGGGCSPDQVRAWVINRYYYQHSIPMKDAAFILRVEYPARRTSWLFRSADPDWTDDNEDGPMPRLRPAVAVCVPPE